MLVDFFVICTDEEDNNTKSAELREIKQRLVKVRQPRIAPERVALIRKRVALLRRSRLIQTLQ